MNTVNKKEIDKFSKLAEEWWNPFGKFKPLHKLNPIRVELIRNKIISHYNLKNGNQPLKKLEILDIGCGGGILSEPISRMGGNVTGVDASEINIKVAKAHANRMGLKINYLCGSLEKITFSKKFDVVLNMEVIEHVLNPKLFLRNCSNVLKSNGIMFVATINRTLKSYIQAIVGAEYILRWLPIGTHDWNNFFKPEELNKLAMECNLSEEDLIGIKFNLFLKEWKSTSDCNVNYLSTFIKN